MTYLQLDGELSFCWINCWHLQYHCAHPTFALKLSLISWTQTLTTKQCSSIHLGSSMLTPASTTASFTMFKVGLKIISVFTLHGRKLHESMLLQFEGIYYLCKPQMSKGPGGICKKHQIICTASSSLSSKRNSLDGRLAKLILRSACDGDITLLDPATVANNAKVLLVGTVFRQGHNENHRVDAHMFWCTTLQSNYKSRTRS